jgi:hypothetical protein
MDLNKTLRQKLRDKIDEKKNQRFQPKSSEVQKVNNQIEEEVKIMNKDKRVNAVMKNWFLEAMKVSPDMEVRYPVYILDNIETEKIKFYEFLIKFMKFVDSEMEEWKDPLLKGIAKLSSELEKREYMENLETEYNKKYKEFFTTPYIIYMSLMTGINIFDDLVKLK